MEWVKTTLRKGTKSPRICRDMFITDSRGKFAFSQLKNGRVVDQKQLTEQEAKAIIKENNLVKRGSCFNNCFTYRDYESSNLIERLLTR